MSIHMIVLTKRMGGDDGKVAINPAFITQVQDKGAKGATVLVAGGHHVDAVAVLETMSEVVDLIQQTQDKGYE